MAKISKAEFKKALSTLRREGLSDTDIAKLKDTFGGDLDEHSLDKGISREEFERAKKRLEQHPGSLSKTQLKKAEAELKEDL